MRTELKKKGQLMLLKGQYMLSRGSNSLWALLSFATLSLMLFSFSSYSQSSGCVEGEIKIGSKIYNTIQMAVNASSGKNVIELGSGFFDEDLDVNRKNNITIQSACFAEVKTLRVRNSNSFTLKGVSIKADEGSNFALSLSNVQGKIEDSHILNAGNSGIEVLGNKSKLLFSKVSVYNNGLHGFLLESGVDVSIVSSFIYSNASAGIYLKNVSSLIIEDTNIYNNKVSGISSYQNTQAISSFLGSTFSLALVVGSEVFGAILMALGLLTRWASFSLLFTMLVAVFMVHLHDPFKDKELAILYSLIFFFFTVKGGGKYSLDYILQKKLT